MNCQNRAIDCHEKCTEYRDFKARTANYNNAYKKAKDDYYNHTSYDAIVFRHDTFKSKGYK
jgi:hypothetical protein